MKSATKATSPNGDANEDRPSKQIFVTSKTRTGDDEMLSQHQSNPHGYCARCKLTQGRNHSQRQGRGCGITNIVSFAAVVVLTFVTRFYKLDEPDHIW